MNISVNEGIVLAIFKAKSKHNSIKKMEGIMEYIAVDQEMTQLVTQVMNKLKKMTDEEYTNLNLEEYKLLLDSAEDDENDEDDEDEENEEGEINGGKNEG